MSLNSAAGAAEFFWTRAAADRARGSSGGAPGRPRGPDSAAGRKKEKAAEKISGSLNFSRDKTDINFV